MPFALDRGLNQVQGDQGVVIGLRKVAIGANADDVGALTELANKAVPIVLADKRLSSERKCSVV